MENNPKPTLQELIEALKSADLELARNEDVYDLVKKGLWRLDHNEFKAAHSLLNKAFEIDEQQTYHYMKEEYRDRNEFEKVEKCYIELLKLDLKNPLRSRYHHDLGCFYFERGDNEKSKLHLKRAISTGKGLQWKSHISLGTVYCDEESWELAVMNYEKGLELGEGSAADIIYDVLFNISHCYSKLKDKSKAKQAIERANEIKKIVEESESYIRVDLIRDKLKEWYQK